MRNGEEEGCERCHQTGLPDVVGLARAANVGTNFML